jgi:hypothetical protein
MDLQCPKERRSTQLITESSNITEVYVRSGATNLKQLFQKCSKFAKVRSFSALPAKSWAIASSPDQHFHWAFNNPPVEFAKVLSFSALASNPTSNRKKHSNLIDTRSFSSQICHPHRSRSPRSDLISISAHSTH